MVFPSPLTASCVCIFVVCPFLVVITSYVFQRLHHHPVTALCGLLRVNISVGVVDETNEFEGQSF